MQDRNIGPGDTFWGEHDGTVYRLRAQTNDKDRLVFKVYEPDDFDREGATGRIGKGLFKSVSAAAGAVTQSASINGWKFWLREGEAPPARSKAGRKRRREIGTIRHNKFKLVTAPIDKDPAEMTATELYRAGLCFECHGPLIVNDHFHTKGTPARDVCCECRGCGGNHGGVIYKGSDREVKARGKHKVGRSRVDGEQAGEARKARKPKKRKAVA